MSIAIWMPIFNGLMQELTTMLPSRSHTSRPPQWISSHLSLCSWTTSWIRSPQRLCCWRASKPTSSWIRPSPQSLCSWRASTTLLTRPSFLKIQDSIPILFLLCCHPPPSLWLTCPSMSRARRSPTSLAPPTQHVVNYQTSQLYLSQKVSTMACIFMSESILMCCIAAARRSAIHCQQSQQPAPGCSPSASYPSHHRPVGGDQQQIVPSNH